jgi:hypothetical protein
MPSSPSALRSAKAFARKALTRARRRLLHRPRHFLAIYAVFQNEAHILREWIDIHRREGVEHFFLLDHGSEDGWRDVIAADIAAGHVTVRSIPASGGHDHARTVHAEMALHAAEWVMVQDLDEFTYAPPARRRCRNSSAACLATFTRWRCPG